MYKRLVFPLTLLTCLSQSGASQAAVRDMWDDFDAMFDEMHRQHQSHFAQLRILMRSAEEQRPPLQTAPSFELRTISGGLELLIPLAHELSSQAVIKFNERGDGRVRITIPLHHGTMTMLLNDRMMQVEQTMEENIGTAEHERWKSAYNSVVRSLPVRIDPSSADATYADGALRVTFVEKQQGTTIAIKQGVSKSAAAPGVIEEQQEKNIDSDLK